MKHASSENRMKILSVVVALALIISVIVGTCYVKNYMNVRKVASGFMGEYSLQNIRGEVFVLRDGVSFFADEGIEVFDGDILRTNERSLAEIYAGDVVLMTLSENTNYTLQILNDKLAVIYDGKRQASNEVASSVGKTEGEHIKDSKTKNPHNHVKKIVRKKGETKGKKAPNGKVRSRKVPNGKVRSRKAPNRKAQNKEGKSSGSVGKSGAKKKAHNASHKTQRKNKKGTQNQNKKKTKRHALPKQIYCTVTIDATTILNHTDELGASKVKLMPQNGFFAKNVRVRLNGGETAFDVLKVVCEESHIPLEYSFTAAYQTYYVEGIGNLYEFDLGGTSGWLYKINGNSLSESASTYVVKNGDYILWEYSD